MGAILLTTFFTPGMLRMGPTTGSFLRNMTTVGKKSLREDIEGGEGWEGCEG